jgi:hypothetical protein
MNSRLLLSVALAAGISALSPLAALAQMAPTVNRVTAATGGVFAGGASFSGVTLSGADTGLGVAIQSDGTAIGDLDATLLGTNVLGQEQDIEVTGQVLAGALNADGSASLSGSSSVDLGDGSAPLLLSFTLTVAGGGSPTMLLVLGSTTLPIQNVTDGTVSIH